MKKSGYLLLAVFWASIWGLASCGSGSPLADSGPPPASPPTQQQVVDADGDGFAADLDCDDGNADIHPEGEEIVGDGVDQDCTGLDRYLTETFLEADRDHNGSPEAILVTRFNEAGQIVFEAADEDADGSFDYRVEFSFYPDGKPDAERVYEGNETEPIYVKFNRYDSAGNLGKIERDLDGDGQINGADTFEYDGEGRLVKARYDENDDGAVDKVVTSEYLHGDSSVRIRYDLGADGSIDSVDQEDFEDGKLQRHLSDVDNDGQFDSAVVYAYDGSGRLIQKLVDRDGLGGEGLWDEVESNVRDAQGRLIERFRDTDGDDVYDTREVWERDPQGYILSDQYDKENDGVFDSIQRYGYDSMSVVDNKDLDAEDSSLIRIPHLQSILYYNGAGQVQGAISLTHQFSE